MGEREGLKGKGKERGLVGAETKISFNNMQNPQTLKLQ